MRVSRLPVVLVAAGAVWGAGLAAAGLAQQPSHDCVVAEARRLPDLGGVYLSEDGRRVHVRVAGASAERREQVRASLAASCNVDHTAVVVEASRYTLAQLRDWTAAANDVLSVDGVAFVGPDERADTLVVGLTKSAAEDEVRRVLAAKGIPDDAVRIERTSPIRTVEGGGPDGAGADDGGAPGWAVPVVAGAAVGGAALGGVLLRRRRLRPRPRPAS